jgi:hypothetical protein
MLTTPCHERANCRLCASPKLESRIQFQSTPPANNFTATKLGALSLIKFPLEVMQCTSCGHHQLRHVVDPSILFTDYAYVSGTSKVFVDHLEDLAEQLKRAGARRAVEVGSNDGCLMKALKTRDVDVVGVEYAQNLVSMCKGEGLEVLGGGGSVENFQRAADLLDPGADFWVACNVLAHINEFGTVMRALHHTKAKRGVFEVQYEQDYLKHGMFDGHYHEHVDYWRVTELVEHLHKYTGWWVERVEKIPTHGGSLRVWVSNGQGFSGVGLANVFLEEEPRDTTKAFKKLRTRIDDAASKLGLLLAPYKTVAAFGAPAKFTTFVAEMGLENRLAYVVDDSPHKQGKFTPGTGIPVVPRTHLEVEKPDVILVTAWNFADSIVKGLGAETPIIIPFPDVKVLQGKP